MSKDLRRQDPLEIAINPNSVVICSVIFAIIFFTLGTLWRYYIPIGA